MSFTETIHAHARTLHPKAPPIPVWHGSYGSLGECVPGKGLITPIRQRASVRAILRDDSRNTIRLLQRFEQYAPRALVAIVAGIYAMRSQDPMSFPAVLGAISNYDGIVSARGNGALQDVWMAMTATQTPVTTSWYDFMNFASWSHATAPTISAYTNAGTGGAVSDATSNGSWLINPQGTNKKYIVSLGVSITAVNGFALGMLYDQLWAGSYVVTSNATINPTTDVTVTRYASTTAGNADYAGGNQMLTTLSTTLTHTVAPVVTTTYTDGNGTTSKTTAYTCPATGALVNRVIGNTTYNTATVINSTPFMSLTNAGTPGVTKLEQVVVSGGTATVGTVSHKIVRPLVIMPFIAANTYVEQDTTLNIGNMVELRNASQVCGCIGWLAFSAGTTAASMSAFMRTVEG